MARYTIHYVTKNNNNKQCVGTFDIYINLGTVCNLLSKIQPRKNFHYYYYYYYYQLFSI